MSALRLLTQQVVGTSFSFYTEDEIRALSVKQITNPQTFDTFNRPTEGGVYDRALGPVDFNIVCPTCGLGAWRERRGLTAVRSTAAAAAPMVCARGQPRAARARTSTRRAAARTNDDARLMTTENMRFH